MSSAPSLQQPSGMPFQKYRPFLESNPVDLPDRTWPTKRIEKAPRWLSTDLRDGNQSLPEPMDPDRKRRLFDLLVRMGYKEIEVGFPSASQMEFDFIRSIIDSGAIPDDVTISVLTQSRPDLIERTVQSLVGLPRATVHLYAATSPVFREVVFGKDKAATCELATSGTRHVMEAAERILGSDTIFGYEYSPEVFVDTELDFALEICEAVMDVWQPEAGREIILNLPATVERATPNVFADQIEWMHRNLSRREFIALSVHPHNDRGTAVATAELSQLAGADRVEGCIFGHGERTGNVDLLTLAMNLFSQGIDPEIDFSDIDEVRRTVEYCTQIRVPERAPYGGDLVFTAFSGSHQDAIKKGFEFRENRLEQEGIADPTALAWDLPYLPVDPMDVGRSYEAVIRVNAQSGKGGIAYLMKSERQLDLPRRLQMEFSGVVQRHADAVGGEIQSEKLWAIFSDEYLSAREVFELTGEEANADMLPAWGRFQVLGTRSESRGNGSDLLSVEVTDNGVPLTLSGEGNGPIAAFIEAFAKIGIHLEVRDYAEHALSQGGDATAAAYVECSVEGVVLWGVGIDTNIMSASLKAIVSAVNRAQREAQ